MSQPQNLAASVRQRLLNLAQSQQENLTRYGIERLLSCCFTWVAGSPHWR
jgi:hypothetical protein